MKIICPNCNNVYYVKGDKKSKTGIVATCNKCGEQIIIEPPLASQEEHPTAPTHIAVSYPSSPSVTRPKEFANMTLLRDYPELRSLSGEKCDLVEILTPNKEGGYKSRKNTLKVEILKAVSGLLGKILREREKVMCVGKGISIPGFPFSRFFIYRTLLYSYNYYAIICTNQRVLLINIDHKIRCPTHYLFQIRYEEIKNVEVVSFPSELTFNRIKGKRWTFDLKRDIAKEITQFVVDKKSSIRAAKYPQEPLENLCPSCFTPLEKRLIKCPHCRAHFKEPKKAFLRSLLLPGLGNIYLGQNVFGILVLLFTAFVWATTISVLMGIEVGTPLEVLLILLVYHLTLGLYTYLVGKKGYIVAKK